MSVREFLQLSYKNHLKLWYFLHFQCLLLAGQAPVSGRMHLTTLVAAYEDYSRKQPATVTDTFLAFEGAAYESFHCIQYCIVIVKKVRNFWVFTTC